MLGSRAGFVHFANIAHVLRDMPRPTLDLRLNDLHCIRSVESTGACDTHFLPHRSQQASYFSTLLRRLRPYPRARPCMAILPSVQLLLVFVSKVKPSSKLESLL